MNILFILTLFHVYYSTSNSDESVLREKCFAAVDSGDVNSLRNLIQKDGIVDEKLLNLREKASKQTLLLKSILMGNTDIVSFLLDAGADLTIPEKDGYTVMDAAAFQGRPEIIKLLSLRGVDLNTMHTDGHRPIHRAIWGTTERHTEAVKTFIDLGVSAETKNDKGQTCLDIANDMPRARRNLATIKLLKESIEKEKKDL